jgi:hypothetical protein
MHTWPAKDLLQENSHQTSATELTRAPFTLDEESLLCANPVVQTLPRPLPAAHMHQRHSPNNANQQRHYRHCHVLLLLPIPLSRSCCRTLDQQLAAVFLLAGASSGADAAAVVGNLSQFEVCCYT